MTPLRRGSGQAFAEVIGDPIAQSKSPAIHNFWLEKLGIDAEYRACHTRAEELEDYFTRRRGDAEWRGCNVTMPHKQAVMAQVDRLDRLAERVGAANTIVREESSLVAFNTDVAGILSALPEELMPHDCEVCILGSGGAARAALVACQERYVHVVLLSVRNRQLGFDLMEEFRMGGSVKPVEDRHNLVTSDVIINATPLGLHGGEPMPAELLKHLSSRTRPIAVLDMVYSPLKTDFLRAAEQAGCHLVDGLAMLIGQAAAAFEKFFGQPAPRQHDAELRALLTA